MTSFIIKILLILLITSIGNLYTQNSKKFDSKVKFARAKYSGGGDWYNDPSAEVNLLKFMEKVTNIPVDPVYEFVDLSTDNLFAFPVIFLTGHGNINLTETEVSKLRSYLDNGGFLFIDDDYGLDEYIRKEIKKVFPDKELVEIPYSHEIYHSHFDFPNGLPKIHEHDDKTPQGFGIFIDKRLCLFYGYESNIGDGWPDPEVHKDPVKKREEALKMGVNILVYALSY